MKKLTFIFFLVIGFFFSYSSLMAQAPSAGPATMAKLDGTTFGKEAIIQSIQQKLPVLNTELQTVQDPAERKYKGLQIVLYKGMLSDLLGGKATRNSYNDNISTFLKDYPQYNEEMVANKWALVNEFNSIVFIN